MLLASTRLVRIHDKGDRTPVVMCHAIAGTVFFYYQLQRSGLLEGPLLAMQALGLDDGETPLGSVVELAARNIALIEAERDIESVHIGGYSFGCVVALEMVRQLEAAGKTPRRLMLMAPSPKSPFEGIPDRALREPRIEKEVAFLLKQALRGMDRIVPRRYKDRLSGVYRAHLNAYHDYIPAPVNCEMSAFVPEAEDSGRDGIMAHWRALSRTRCDIRAVPGDHKSMLRKPHVTRLVDEFEADLRRLPSDAADRPPAVRPITALPRRGSARVNEKSGH